MPTQYPTAADTFSNLEIAPGPLANILQNLANLNDAVEALQAKLGIDPDGRSVFTHSDTPVAGAQATLSTALAGDNNDLDFTAVPYGAAGNAITITFVDPADADVELAIDVTGTDIVVTLATDVSEVITTTADLFKTALEADAVASALVTAADKAANDGSGLLTAMAEAPLANGADASKAGLAFVGALLVDTATGTLYVNTGTQAEPVWEELAAPA